MESYLHNIVNNQFQLYNILSISAGENKGLHSYLEDPSKNKHLSAQWNSFSRIDVIGHNNVGAVTRSRTLGSILIDADAITLILITASKITQQHSWVKKLSDKSTKWMTYNTPIDE